MFHVLSRLVHTNGYTFTDCNKSLMNRGRPNQRIVYNTTLSSQVVNNGPVVDGLSLSQLTDNLVSYQVMSMCCHGDECYYGS